MGPRWVQDDAYISFRYARSLVEGNGLVFNVGERVEGFTNFLWTLMSAALTRDRSVFGEAELYHMWYLQETRGGDHEGTNAP